MTLGHGFEPLRGNGRQKLRKQLLRPLEDFREYAIEAIEVALVLHQAQARQVIEILGGNVSDASAQRFEQRQELGQRHGHPALTQLEEEVHQHED
jgi:hypothetical protein